MTIQLGTSHLVQALDNHGLPNQVYRDSLQDALDFAEANAQYGPVYIIPTIKVEEV